MQHSLIWRKKNHPMFVLLLEHEGRSLLHLTQRSGDGFKPSLICSSVQHIHIPFSFTKKSKI